MIRSPLLCAESVGREAPLKALMDRLDRTVNGSGTVLLLGGSAGVGKSRLVRDFKQEAASRGVRTVEGRCSAAESSVPYAPFMDALRFRIARGEGQAVASVLGPLREVLAPIFPQLPGTTEHIDATPDRPFELIYSVLARLAGEDPMVLVLEDVHWADQTSLELLQRIAHRASSLKLLLVATYRSDELHASHPLRRLLGSLARERVGDTITLDPLTQEETAEMLRCMLDADPDPSFVLAIWKRAEGNPFFVEELVTALAEGGPVQPTAEAARALDRAKLPETVSEVVLARVHAMGPTALDTLSAAAVLGRTVEFDVLREVLGMSEEALLGVIEQLVAHQLLREDRTGDGEQYTFPHALMQEALYESVIARRRRLLHRQVADVIERRGAPRTSTRMEQLAYHFRLGGDHTKAYEYSVLAGDEAVRLRAWDDAQSHYEHGLESLEELGDGGARSSPLLEKLADVAWRQSRPVIARQYIEEALRLRRALSQEEETARLLRRLAALRLEEGEEEGAARDLDEALRILSKTPQSPELGPVFDDLGRMSLSSGDLRGAEELLLRGLARPGAEGSGAEEVLALVGLGEIGVLKGHTSAAVTTLDVAFEILREERLPFERATRVFASGIRALVLAQRYQRAVMWAEAAVEVCREQGVGSLESLFEVLRAAALTVTGTEEDTIANVTESVARLRAAGRPELREGLRVLGFVHRVRGDLDLARRAYEEAIQLGDRGTAVGLALVALAEGRAKEAADDLERAIRGVPEGQGILARHILPYAVEALLAADRVDDALGVIDATPKPADESEPDTEHTYARGLIALATGADDRGVSLLGEAAAAWAAIENCLLEARANVFLVEALFASGDREAAERLGRSLLDELGVNGQTRERERVRRILRRAGIRTRSETRGSTPSQTKPVLTSREESVLREVAQGRTNKEIAKALGIAEKTVSVHVSHILAKLGCRTRTQAARFYGG